MVQIQVLGQDPEVPQTHLYEMMNRYLSSPDLNAVRIAMAYVNWGGLSLVAEALEKFLARRKSLQTVFGIGNGVTTPDALCYSHYLKGLFSSYTDALGFEWDFADSTFHPKLIEFEYEDHCVVVIGSANLTNGGMAFNHELCVALTIPKSDPVSLSIKMLWESYWSSAKRIDPQLIQKLSKEHRLGREGQKEQPSRQRIGLSLQRAKKPLFAYILDGNSSQKQKHQTLAETSTLSEKPEKLFLQILGETGGGHQVQLPVATLSTFFGVGSGDVRNVTFYFPHSEPIQVQLTHFVNNTHRVRLRPIRDVPRPAILVFQRTEKEDVYDVQVISSSRYQVILRDRCREQTRNGSRYWGFQ
jgi:hypothetical protein